MKRRITICITAVLITAGAYLYSQMPVSREGTIVETISHAEVMVEATGVYHGEGRNERAKRRDVDDNGITNSLIDARRSAIYTVLFSGTDPMLRLPEERNAFEGHVDYFFDPQTMTKYITFEESHFQTRRIIDGGTGIRVSKNFRVNKENLYRDLVARNITVAREDLAAQVGNPIIMVIPDAPAGKNPIEMLTTNQELRHAASVVQSYLTARGYDVIVPEQQALLADLASAQTMISGGERDYAYELALSIGSDVYITYSGSVQQAGRGTERYAMNVSAFETTTARLLGTETGYSAAVAGAGHMALIEDAMNTAVDNVLSRVMSYWRTDLERGLQYKIIVNIEPHFDDQQLDEIHLAWMDAVDEIAKSSRELVLTKQTIDYLIWVDSNRYDRALRVYRDLKNAFDSAGSDGVLSSINMNRKMLLLKIDY